MTRPLKEERIRYNVDYPQDTAFSANARLLQSKWREGKGYPELKLGNFLDIDFAKRTKSNFLTTNIKQLVTKEVANIKKTGALIGEPRIWNNLLSSQPLCFNLFGELHFDLDLATNFFQKIFPNLLDRVIDIKFEYSPGRGNNKYIGDHSAFDVFVEYSKDDRTGFIGIEVKYAESLREETMAKATKNFKPLYENLTINSGFFKPNTVGFLKRPPIAQIWRDHLLAIATKQDYDEGFFVFLFPSKNNQCQKGVDSYQQYLMFDNNKQNCFYPMHLEYFIDTMIKVANVEWANELKMRYLGFEE